MTLHHPRGEMCLSCVRLDRRCDHIPFVDCRPLETYTQDEQSFVEVKCAEYTREETK